MLTCMQQELSGKLTSLVCYLRGGRADLTLCGVVLCACMCLLLQGIYFAAKSGRMCADAIVEASQNGKKMCGEAAIRVYLDK